MPRFTTSDGLSLYYEDEGTGQALLCLSGLTRNSRDFDPVAPHLSEPRLIRLDYRGRGQSDHDPNPAGYNVMREAQDVLELLDHLSLPRVTVLGTSRGGLIAMALAASARARLAGVILNDVGPEVSAEGIARIIAYVGKAPDWSDLDSAAAGLQAALERQFPGVPLARWRLLADAQYRVEGGGLVLRYDPRLADALRAQAEAGSPPDLWPLFAALKGVPTGVIRGANSDILSPETLAQMQDTLPDMHSVVIKDRGHVPFLDEPEALALIRTVLEEAA